MNSQFKKLLTIAGVVALTLVLFTTTAWATPITPGDNGNGNANPSGLAQMIQWMGPANWSQMVQRMNQVHGPEFTGRMFQQMNQSGACYDGEHSAPGSMMGRGFGGMMGQGFGNQMGPGFQNRDGNGQSGPGFGGSMMNGRLGR